MLLGPHLKSRLEAERATVQARIENIKAGRYKTGDQTSGGQLIDRTPEAIADGERLLKVIADTLTMIDNDE